MLADEMNDNSEQPKDEGINWWGLIVRFVVATVALMITSWLVPGFKNMGVGTSLIAAIVIAIMDFLIEKIFKLDASPFGRGIIGFIIATAIIYLTQFLVPGMSITLFAAIIAALIIGLMDLILPSRIM
ncbi:MAG: hypothetical protein PWP48_920 [Clostridiales bacterium]|nr:hypothetical protein [Clostridiales bacterium]MDK2991687.1 hypothetical protein [Clostridiales bacterium]